MKLIFASLLAVVSVGAGGYFAINSETETGEKLYRSLLGINEVEVNTCSGVESKPACSSESKPDCGSSCDEEKPQDQFPT